jgi:tetratricopeptide (TPR) repeat protein
MASKRPTEAPREEHLGDARAQARFMLWILGPPFVGGLLLWRFGGPVLSLLGGLFLGASFAALAVYAVVFLMRVTVVDSAGSAAGKLLMPDGSTTPPAKPLSHIEAMVARGDYARAADAYQAEIDTDPVDVTSCDRLGQLALRELKDAPRALRAFREGEKRAEAPARKFGFALQIAGIYRDHLRDRGKAVRELSRVLSLYPDMPRIEAVRAELDEL